MHTRMAGRRWQKPSQQCFGEMAASSSQDQKNDRASRFKEQNARTIVIIYRLDPSKHLGKV
jgi:hypothetical protein